MSILIANQIADGPQSGIMVIRCNLNLFARKLFSITMPRVLRISLIVLGILLICCSLAVLIFSYWPVDVETIQATLEPTLFISP